MKAKQAGILAVILGSICCIGPLLLLAIGVGSGAVFIGRYHWFFIIAAMAILTWAWAKYLREKTVCDCEHKPRPEHKPLRVWRRAACSARPTLERLESHRHYS